ncbi:MAG: prolipoprotein diacylglyceryl transferase [Candidatus Omnitrophica bacterium]|nr:prolipoprotein diacylglyceryl transferase [Candidatus Omnitrophota bacterium]
MRPVLFSFGKIQIYTYGTLIAAGVMCALFLMSRQARKTGFPETDKVFDLVFMAIISGFLGARIAYVIENFDWYRTHLLEIPAVWQGGLIFYGGLFAGLAVLIGYFRFQKIPVLKGFDFLVPYVALVHFFGRLGCFFNGCCYGKACHSEILLRWFSHRPLLHPAQIYEAVYDLGLFFFLRDCYSRRRFDGEITAQYFALYALGRFVIEFFRDGNSGWGVFTWNQWASLLILFVCLMILLVKIREGKSKNHG